LVGRERRRRNVSVELDWGNVSGVRDRWSGVTEEIFIVE
jgi:hypothetical protein